MSCLLALFNRSRMIQRLPECHSMCFRVVHIELRIPFRPLPDKRALTLQWFGTLNGSGLFQTSGKRVFSTSGKGFPGFAGSLAGALNDNQRLKNSCKILQLEI